jgi:hypothetical protein
MIFTIHTAEELARDDLPFIKSQTNPWVEIEGNVIYWDFPIWEAQRRLPEDEEGEDFCDGCNGTILPGVIEAMDTPEGIQACDSCRRYPGDLDAAWALAKFVLGESAVVRYDTEGETND